MANEINLNGTTACGNGEPINGRTTARASGDFEGLGFPTWGRQGWICPKCGNVMSPDTSYCIFCAKGNSGAIVQTTPDLDLSTSEWNSTYTRPGEVKITRCN